jgi:bifunctional non-homologous end joining protein LigD
MAQARRAVSNPKSTDGQLHRYRSMRDFHVTQEPSGHKVRAAKSASELPFVIQKHAATRLHYDFRLGWNGVLKSWAVTKGPSYYPGDKRLAVQVEDHPMEYGGFEGIIPKGQYGGGTVMLWDRGTWEPHVDVEEGLRKGSLKFALHGEKMHGNWALVRMHPRPGDRSDKPNWLLIKEHDEFERSQEDTPITEEAPKSVLTKRDLDAIARADDRVWQSNHAESKAAATNGHRKTEPRAQAKPVERDWLKELRGMPKETLPKFISPQLASLAKSPPAGERWVHEIKLDGYRIQARIDGKKRAVHLTTRNGLDWTHRMKPVADAVLHLPVKSALIDGEVVVLTANGASSFAELQAAFQEGAKAKLTYFAFDLLHLDGHNLRGMPLLERKKILEHMLAGSGDPGTIRLSEHIQGEGKQIFAKACDLGTEGIISKIADGKYSPGRGGSWLKIKCYREQELVIGGFTLPTNGIHGVGALLLGYYRDGKLIFAGKTGTGFTQKTHKLIRDKLDKLRSAKTPFAEIPRDAKRDAIWVKPELVAQVNFSTWTADHLIRQASFKGLREDKPAKSVVLEEVERETEASAEKRVRKASSHKHNAPAAKSGSETEMEDLPIRLTHPDKVLDASTGVTKEQLARYYWEVSAVMLPHVADRPLTLVRCVEGSGKPCFYQKHKNQMLAGLGSVDVVNRKTGAHEPYITLNTRESIVQLAQIGVLEVHPWGSRNETMEQPDRIVIDLDPDAAIDWPTLVASAKEVRKRLQKRGLKSFVKTTGGKGLHVVVPIRPEHEWPQVKQFTHEFVLAMEREFPKQFLTKMTKAARVGKIFLDYLRNDRGATAVAPYSPRARSGLPVAMYLSWSELDQEELPRFQVSDIQVWRKRLGRDPWKEMLKLDQRLDLA